MGCCTLSSCSPTKRPRRLVSTIQKKGVGIGKKGEVVEVQDDDVKLSKGEVRPAN